MLAATGRWAPVQASASWRLLTHGDGGAARHTWRVSLFRGYPLFLMPNASDPDPVCVPVSCSVTVTPWAGVWLSVVG